MLSDVSKHTQTHITPLHIHPCVQMYICKHTHTHTCTEVCKILNVTDIPMLSTGTGNVLKVQHLLHICSEHDDSKDQVSWFKLSSAWWTLSHVTLSRKQSSVWKLRALAKTLILMGEKMSSISSVKYDIQLDGSAHSFYAFLYTTVAVFIKVYYNVGFEVWWLKKWYTMQNVLLWNCFGVFLILLETLQQHSCLCKSVVSMLTCITHMVLSMRHAHVVSCGLCSLSLQDNNEKKEDKNKKKDDKKEKEKEPAGPDLSMQQGKHTPPPRSGR